MRKNIMSDDSDTGYLGLKNLKSLLITPIFFLEINILCGNEWDIVNMLASNYKSAVVKEQESNNRCCCILTQRKIKAFLFKQPSEFRRRCTLMHHDVLAVQTVEDLRVYDIAPECTMSVPL